MSESLWPHELQHAKPPCPSPTPGVYPNSCPSSRWWHSAISSSVVPFLSCPQSLPASGSFPNESTLCMRWPKYWSYSFSISLSNEHPGLISFRMDWLDLLAKWLKDLNIRHDTIKLLEENIGKTFWWAIMTKNFLRINKWHKRSDLKRIMNQDEYKAAHTHVLLLLSRFSRVRLCATP